MDPELFKKAQKHHREGQYAEAEHIYRQLLAEAPENIDVQYCLATLAKETGNEDAALLMFNDMLKRYPASPKIVFSLGDCFLRKHQWDRALICFKRAFSMQPDYAEAAHFIGMCMKNLGSAAEAKPWFEKALSLQPDFAYSLNDLGHIYFEEGHLQQAAELLDRAMALSINRKGNLHELYENAVHNQMRTLLASNHIAELSEKLDTWLMDEHISDEVHYGMLIYKTILAMLSNQPLEAEAVLESAEPIFEDGQMQLKQVHLAYHIFLQKLLDFRHAHPELYTTQAMDEVYLVGDSHCLSASYTELNVDGQAFLAVPKLVMGCKAWHLSGTAHNSYKETLHRVLESLPKRSDIICFFGEIDTRPNEGIWKHFKKQGGADYARLEPEVALFVEEYVAHVKQAAQARGHRLKLANVPHPRNEPGDGVSDDYMFVVQLFNKQLSEACTRHGIGIINLYGLTLPMQGTTNGAYYLERRHLLPTALQQALQLS